MTAFDKFLPNQSTGKQVLYGVSCGLMTLNLLTVTIDKLKVQADFCHNSNYCEWLNECSSTNVVWVLRES